MNNVEKFTLGVLGTSAVVAGVLAARGKKRRAMDHQKPYYKNYHKPAGFYEAHVKRPLGGYLASLGLVTLSPVLAVTALLVKKNLGSPLLFEQARPGKDGKIFKLYKFRTMTDATDASGKPLSDADRLTPFGEKLRSTSIEGNDIIGQTTESLVNKGFREASPIHFFTGRDLFSKRTDLFDIEGGMNLLAVNQGQEAFRAA